MSDVKMSAFAERTKRYIESLSEMKITDIELELLEDNMKAYLGYYEYEILPPILAGAAAQAYLDLAEAEEFINEGGEFIESISDNGQSIKFNNTMALNIMNSRPDELYGKYGDILRRHRVIRIG